MRYFYDTEFIDNGRTIELISIGVAAEDGREYYAVSTEFNPERAGSWVRRHVLPKLPSPASQVWRSRRQIRMDLEDFFGVESADDLPFGNDDAEVTTAIDAGVFGAAKAEAMRAHATQISVDGPFFALSNNIGHEVLGTEYFRLVRGELAGARNDDGRETDLFAGVRAP